MRQSVAETEEVMQKRVFAMVSCLALLSLSSFGASNKGERSNAGPPPDRAYLQKIWDGWGKLDANRQGQFFASGDHTFFDVAPLKYNSWQEYEAGVAKELADYKSATFTLNDDVQIHPAGAYVWATATVKEDATLKTGKRELATFRWTVVLENQEGKWLIVHEHVSEPVQ
jgi:ketosteroid isomerase-like protein